MEVQFDPANNDVAMRQAPWAGESEFAIDPDAIKLMNGAEWAGRVRSQIQKPVVGQDVVIERLLMALRVCVDKVHVSDELQRYMLALVRATRNLATSQPAARDLAEGQGAKKHVTLSTLSFGASPRATLALVQAVRALAFIRGQDFATPELVQEIFLDAVHHRLGVTCEAEKISADDVLRHVLDATPVPEKV